MTIGTSIVLIAVGAIMKWAVTATVKGFDLQTAGTVLLVVGILGLVLSLIYSSIGRGETPPPRRFANVGIRATRAPDR